ncbi:hypothetical protein HZB04_03685 [Candidatus Wolfebacteria bacterium]|nr:hypothetical protein [Candidatus Wolfebacteria bacterium]
MIKMIDYDHLIGNFKKEYGIHNIIAFSGGADIELNGIPSDDPIQEQYKKFITALEERIIGYCIGKFRGYQIAILTGGTKWGIPKTATFTAKKFGLKTIGIYPLIGKKHALDKNMFDLEICVEHLFGESRWGDESPIFANLLDGVVVFSGGAGTLIECTHVLKINEALKKSGLPLKYIVPISGTGGVADGLPFVWAKPEIRFLCMPSFRIITGLQVADILRDK